MPISASYLGRVGGVKPVPRDRLDAGAVPQLRPPGDRLRRLPLPGVSADRRSGVLTQPAICPPITSSWPTRCAARRPSPGATRLGHRGAAAGRQSHSPPAGPSPSPAAAPFRGKHEPGIPGGVTARSLAAASSLLHRTPLLDGHNDLAWKIREHFSLDPGAWTRDTVRHKRILIYPGCGGVRWAPSSGRCMCRARWQATLL